MVDWTKPIKRADGVGARFLGRVSKKGTPVVVAIGNPLTSEFIGYYSEDGYSRYEGEGLDIVNVPEKKLKERVHVGHHSWQGQGGPYYTHPVGSACVRAVANGNGVIVEVEI